MQLHLQLSYTVETDKAKISFLISVIVIQRFCYDSVLKSYVKCNILLNSSFHLFFIRMIRGWHASDTRMKF